MLTVFGDIFVAGKCLFRYILVCINIIANNEIVEFFNFCFENFSSLVIRVTSTYQKEYALRLTPLVTNMTSHILPFESFFAYDLRLIVHDRTLLKLS